MSAIVERLKVLQAKIDEVEAESNLQNETIGKLLQANNAIAHKLIALENQFNTSRDLYTNLGDYLYALNGTFTDEQKTRLSKDVVELQASRRKTQISTSLTNGEIAVTDKVTKDSVLVVEETIKGELIDSYGVVLFSKTNPELQSQLLDKEVGFLLTIKEGHVFKILEIYNLVVKNEEASKS